MKTGKKTDNFDLEFGSVSMESIMDTITRVYMGITVLSLAAQVVFPFYNHLKGNRDDATQSVQNFTKSYLTGACFNTTAGGTCATPTIPITTTTTPIT